MSPCLVFIRQLQYYSLLCLDTFDLTNQGTLSLVSVCSGTKMPLMRHLRTGDLKCPCISKSKYPNNIQTIVFAIAYYYL